MRPGSAVVAATLTVLAVGINYTRGRPDSLDVVTARVDTNLPASTHLVHWAAPSAGSAKSLAACVSSAGTGAGNVTYKVEVDNVGVICTLTVPCAEQPGGMPSATCESTAIPSGAGVHLTMSHSCDTLPVGSIAAAFRWRP